MADWITPSSTNNSSLLDVIGEINYGTTSSMFVYSYPSVNSSGTVLDTTYAAYNKLVDLTDAEKSNFSGHNVYFAKANSTPTPGTTDVPISCTVSNVSKATGLSIASNGQVVGKLSYTDQNYYIVFKVQLVSPPEYTANMTYRAYTIVKYNEKYYKLKKDISTPYISSTEFDSTKWDIVNAGTVSYTTYVKGATYSSNSIIKYNNVLYRLSDYSTSNLQCVDAVPSSLYWDVIDTSYDYRKYNPALYTPNNTYYINDYVQNSGNVYQLTSTPQYTAPATFDSSIWTIADGSYNVEAYNPTNTYTVGNSYTSGSYIKNLGSVYQLKNSNFYSQGSTPTDLNYWSLYRNYDSSVVGLPAYASGTTYSNNTYVDYNGYAYKLSLSGSSITAISAIPDSNWINKGTYNVEAYNPSVQYTNNTRYENNSYVAYDTSVYQLNDIPYYTTQNTPDSNYWITLVDFDKNSIQPDLPFTTNYGYSTGEYAWYNDASIIKVYQFSSTTWMSESTDPNITYWTNNGTYDAEAYNPTVPYSQGLVVQSNQYVSYNSYVYRVKNLGSWISSDATPSLTFWSVYDNNYDANKYNPSKVFGTDAIYTNDYCIYDNKVYQLTATNYYSSSSTPDWLYWSMDREYTLESLVPSLVYTPDVVYQYNTYVQYDSKVYQLTGVTQYTAPAVFDVSVWTLIGDVGAVDAYVMNATYSLNDRVTYDGYIWTLNSLNYKNIATFNSSDFLYINPQIVASEYVQGALYATGEYCISSNALYKLNVEDNASFGAPSSYFTNLGTVEAYSPSVVYTNGGAFTANEYVSYNSKVYKLNYTSCINALTEPDSTYTNLGTVEAYNPSVAYANGGSFTANEYVSYNGKVYQSISDYTSSTDIPDSNFTYIRDVVLVSVFPSVGDIVSFDVLYVYNSDVYTLNAPTSYTSSTDIPDSNFTYIRDVVSVSVFPSVGDVAYLGNTYLYNSDVYEYSYFVSSTDIPDSNFTYIRDVVSIPTFPAAGLSIQFGTDYQYAGIVYSLPSVSFTTSTIIPDSTYFSAVRIITSVNDYIQGTVYNKNDIVKYSGYVYTFDNIYYVNTSTSPDSKWTVIGEYNSINTYTEGAAYDNLTDCYAVSNGIYYKLQNAKYLSNTSIIDSTYWTFVRAIEIVQPYTLGTVYTSGVTCTYNSNAYLLSDTSKLTTVTSVPDVRFWVNKGLSISSSAKQYIQNNVYQLNDLCVDSGYVYKLSNSTYIAELATISTNEWTLIRTVIDASNYTIGALYGTGSYALYNSVLYKLRQVPYVPTSLTPDANYWVLIGQSINNITEYSPGTIYALNSYVTFNSTLYQLNRITFTAQSDAPDERFWISYVDNPFGTASTRLFAIAINSNSTNNYDFSATDTSNSTFFVGTRFGELIQYSINLGTSVYTTYQQTGGTMPYGTYISASGNVCGVVKARSRADNGYGNFTFDVTARTSTNVSKTSEITFTVPLKRSGVVTSDKTAGFYDTTTSTGYIDKGYRLSTVQADLIIPKIHERAWFKMIANRAFTEAEYYNQTDKHYGLQRLPVLPIKRNILGCLNNDYQQMQTPQMMNNIIKQNITSDIKFKTGNTRYIVALDNNYNPLYELVYKELLPVNQPYVESTEYSDYPLHDIKEITKLRSDLISLFGSDDVFSTSESDLYSFTSVYDSSTATFDDCYLYRANPKKSLMSNLAYSTPNGSYNRDCTQFLPILPIAFLAPGESVKLFNKIAEYELTDMFSNIIIDVNSLRLTPQGAMYSKESIVQIPKN